jgi:hypothetical protein
MVILQFRIQLLNNVEPMMDLTKLAKHIDQQIRSNDGCNQVRYLEPHWIKDLSFLSSLRGFSPPPSSHSKEH